MFFFILNIRVSFQRLSCLTTFLRESLMQNLFSLLLTIHQECRILPEQKRVLIPLCFDMKFSYSLTLARCPNIQCGRSNDFVSKKVFVRSKSQTTQVLLSIVLRRNSPQNRCECCLQGVEGGTDRAILRATSVSRASLASKSGQESQLNRPRVSYP